MGQCKKNFTQIIYGLAGEKIYINNVWTNARKILYKIMYAPVREKVYIK